MLEEWLQLTEYPPRIFAGVDDQVCHGLVGVERGDQIFVDRCRSDVVKAVSLQTTPCAGNDVVQQLPLPSAQVVIGVFFMLGWADANLLVCVPVPIHLQRFSEEAGGDFSVTWKL